MIAEFLISHIAGQRKPDLVIGGHSDPYMRRWWIIPRNRFFNIYLHHFLRSDDDRAEHTLPYAWNISWLLSGGYREWIKGKPVDRKTGQIKFRWGASQHRIELTEGACWTLFITGPVVRQWGFLCAKGFVHWKDFTAPHDSGVIGRGCSNADQV